MNRVIYLSALTVMVFFRRRIGYRAINPFHFLCAVAIVGFVGVLGEPGASFDNPPALAFFALLSLFFGVCHRNQRKQELKKGIVQHTYYIGTSAFHSGKDPEFLRCNRRMERFIDPLCCSLLGYSLLPYSRPLAYWLMFAALCVYFLEQYVHLKELNQGLDMLDGIVHSEIQSRNVEEYEEGPRTAQKQGDAGLPTGLAPDVQQQIKQRRAK